VAIARGARLAQAKLPCKRSMSGKLRIGQAGFCVAIPALDVIHERPWPLATFGDNLK